MANMSEVNKLNEITKEMARKVMELRTVGTCAWCGGHNRELLVKTWQIGGELRIGWVCKKCLEEVSGNGFQEEGYQRIGALQFRRKSRLCRMPV